MKVTLAVGLYYEPTLYVEEDHLTECPTQVDLYWVSRIITKKGEGGSTVLRVIPGGLPSLAHFSFYHGPLLKYGRSKSITVMILEHNKEKSNGLVNPAFTLPDLVKRIVTVWGGGGGTGQGDGWRQLVSYLPLE